MPCILLWGESLPACPGFEQCGPLCTNQYESSQWLLLFSPVTLLQLCTPFPCTSLPTWCSAQLKKTSRIPSTMLPNQKVIVTREGTNCTRRCPLFHLLETNTGLFPWSPLSRILSSLCSTALPSPAPFSSGLTLPERAWWESLCAASPPAPSQSAVC